MFDEKFRVCYADTSAGVALHQRIRYQVFCRDKGFEDPDAFPRAEEADAFDDQSVHFVVQDKRTGRWVAATRLVLPKRNRLLPVDALSAFDRRRVPEPTAQIGEVSRFCVMNSLPSATELATNLADWPARTSLELGNVVSSERLEVILGMLRATSIFALKRRMEWFVVFINHAFARILRGLGIVMRQVGPVVEHRGLRTAYLINARESILSVSQKSTNMREFFRRSRLAYVRISLVADNPHVECVSEFATGHALFEESIFRESSFRDLNAGPRVAAAG
ncbi:MAG: PEP-CTERM/exosortase system-associated acyltransferase [Gammaproteobacteria bacterium]|nr:PEP-CTERM/exosortase system-associated acyltransferase [Gammaproteobacteria bacterium]